MAMDIAIAIAVVIALNKYCQTSLVHIQLNNFIWNFTAKWRYMSQCVAMWGHLASIDSTFSIEEVFEFKSIK